MNVGDILIDAKEVYHEFTKASNAARTEISDVQWVRWMDEWQEETSIMTKNPRKEATATSDAGRNYDFPSDFLILSTNKIKFKINGGDYDEIVYTPFELMGNRYGGTWEDDDAGVPQTFTIPTPDTFYLHPSPNAANQGSAFILLNYVFRPPVLSHRRLGESPSIHASYHRSAKFFMASRAHNYLGNPNLAKSLMGDWVESVKGKIVGRKDLIEGKVKTKFFRWG